MGVVVSRLVGRGGFETRPYAVPASAGMTWLWRGNDVALARERRGLAMVSHARAMVSFARWYGVMGENFHVREATEHHHDYVR